MMYSTTTASGTNITMAQLYNNSLNQGTTTTLGWITGNTTNSGSAWIPLHTPRTRTVVREIPARYNRFMVTSDVVEEFLQFAKQADLSQEEFLALPLELFLRFLVIQAADEDEDVELEEIGLFCDIADLKKLPAPKEDHAWPDGLLSLPG